MNRLTLFNGRGADTRGLLVSPKLLSHQGVQLLSFDPHDVRRL